MKKLLYFSIFTFALLIAQSCSDKVEERIHHYSEEEYAILSQDLNLPQETFDYTLVTNRTSVTAGIGGTFHKATLGRVLFYDKKLSKNGVTSCASCHKQEAAFADNNRFSEGLNGEVSTRNSLPLGNTIGFVKYYGTDLSRQAGFFSWDEKFESIDEQSKAAITSSIEMGHDMDALIEEIKEIPYYKILFKKTYGSEAGNNITKENLLGALTEFVNSFSSRESKFDEGLTKSGGGFNAFSEFQEFSNTENMGKDLFNTNCSRCHGSSHNAIVTSSANNGLDMEYADKGLGAKLDDSNYDGIFKVPSLRNIDLTGPYMHDGRFETLMDVINHYSSGIQNHKNLSSPLRSGGNAKKFNFSDSEKEALVDYLKTLTDVKFVTAEKYSDPFK